MIKGMHALLYTSEPEAARALFRDAFGWPATDAGDGWLIFKAPEADLGCHPTAGDPMHAVSFYCEDIKATISSLEAKGVTFTSPIREEDWGFVTTFALPGGGDIQLYEPKY